MAENEDTSKEVSLKLKAEYQDISDVIDCELGRPVLLTLIFPLGIMTASVGIHIVPLV